MSKFVKGLMTEELKSKWDGVQDALLLDVMALGANQSVVLRKRLRAKDIHLMVVKNSLGRRASKGTPLAPAFEGVSGSLAVLWGSSDIVSLAKEVTSIVGAKEYEKVVPKGGVMDGAALSADEVKQVSKWPSREELICIVAGQVTGIGGQLASQLIAPAQQLASQIEKLIEMKEQGGA